MTSLEAIQALLLLITALEKSASSALAISQMLQKMKEEGRETLSDEELSLIVTARENARKAAYNVLYPPVNEQ